MSPADRIYWQRANRRVQGMQPEIRDAILRAFQIIRDNLSDAELTRIIASGNIDAIFQKALTEAVLDRAFIPVRQRIRQVAERSFKYATADLPKGGKVNGSLAISFDYLSPNVIVGVRSLDTKALDTLKGDVKETVRAFAENGLRDGRAPSSVAREVRSVIGLAPNQEAAVRNFERMLRDGDREALTRALRDRRYDRTLAKALGATGDGLSDVQVEKMTAAYKRKFIDFNANVNAKALTFDSYKTGQRLNWEDAITKGVVERERLHKQWVHLDEQPNPRPEHAAMQGEVVPFDQPFSNGQQIPGLGDFGCHCHARYFTK